MKKNFGKKYCNLILTFLCISIFGIGFSSFIIGTTGDFNNELNDINISYGNLYSMSDFVYLDRTKGDNYSGIDMFEYNSQGFVNDETVTNFCNITFFILLDTNNFYNAIGQSVINMQLTLKYENIDKNNFVLLTSEYFNANDSNILIYEGENLISTINSSFINFAVDDSTKEIAFSYKYNFDSDSANVFKKTLFEVSYSFNASNNNYSALYSNELNLGINSAKYILNLEII